MKKKWAPPAGSVQSKAGWKCYTEVKPGTWGARRRDLWPEGFAADLSGLCFTAAPHCLHSGLHRLFTHLTRCGSLQLIALAPVCFLNCCQNNLKHILSPFTALLRTSCSSLLPTEYNFSFLPRPSQRPASPHCCSSAYPSHFP